MAKCRMLLQENEELGKMISSGRTAKLEAEIALHKTMVAEMKTNQDGVFPQFYSLTMAKVVDMEYVELQLYLASLKRQCTNCHVLTTGDEKVWCC